MTDPSIEDVDGFRERARTWLHENMPTATAGTGFEETRFSGYEAMVQRHRQLQRKLWDGGFAGICFPSEYGGLGLTAAHRAAFNEEAVSYEMPTAFNTPTFSIVAATLLDFGTEEQLRRHIPAMLRGEELWSQFLSEPSGGSDVAGALTNAVQDGEEWVLNGSKIWTTYADHADYALCLARTNWQVPKHRGLSVFIVKIHQPAIEIRRIKMVNGSDEFCEEFLTDVRVPARDVVGKINDGWTVGTRWMYHERNGSGGGSVLTVGAGNGSQTTADDTLLRSAIAAGLATDSRAQQLVGQGRVLDTVYMQLVGRLTEGIRAGHLDPNHAGLLKMLRAEVGIQRATAALHLAGRAAIAWDAGDRDGFATGHDFVMRQTAAIGGGTVEMSRNVISERVLGMPREAAGDRDRPFSDVRQNVRADRGPS